MEPNLRAHRCVEHAVAADRLTEAELEVVLRTVRPLTARALDAAPQLLNLGDPFEAETQGAVAASQILGLDHGRVRTAVAVFAALAGRENDAAASALLHATEVVVGGPARRYVGAEIERLAQAGVPRPRWEPLLRSPVRPGKAWTCSPVLESGGAPHAVMAFEFERAGAAHGFIVHRDFRDDGSISKISAIPNIGWDSFRKFLLAGEAFKSPYAIGEVAFDRAVDRFSGLCAAMRSRLRHDPARFTADPDIAALPGLALLLEAHIAAAP